jgi:hypothetical protein
VDRKPNFTRAIRLNNILPFASGEKSLVPLQDTWFITIIHSLILKRTKIFPSDSKS